MLIETNRPNLTGTDTPASNLAELLIERSISHSEIVTATVTRAQIDLVRNELAIRDDGDGDIVENDGVTELWGTVEGEGDWRVHLVMEDDDPGAPDYEDEEDYYDADGPDPEAVAAVEDTEATVVNFWLGELAARAVLADRPALLALARERDADFTETVAILGEKVYLDAMAGAAAAGWQAGDNADSDDEVA